MEPLKQKITELVGEASMCWNPIPAGEFNSEKALDVVNRIMEEVEKEIKLSAEFK